MADVARNGKAEEEEDVSIRTKPQAYCSDSVQFSTKMLNLIFGMHFTFIFSCIIHSFVTSHKY